MPNPNPGSLDWLDDLEAVAAQSSQNTKFKPKDIAKNLGLEYNTVRVLVGLKSAFDTDLIQRVRQAAQGQPPHILSFSAARALASLKGRKLDLKAALEAVISHQLAPLGIEALGDWMVEGHPAQDFDPTRVRRKRRSDAKAPTKATQPGSEEVSDEETSTPETHKEIKPKGSKSSGQEPHKPSLLLNALIGNSPIKGIKKKIKKGEEVSGGEEALLAGSGFLHLVKEAWKLLKPKVHEALHKYKQFAKGTAHFFVPHRHSRQPNLSNLSGNLLHYAIYWGLLLWPLWLILGFVPFLRNFIVYGIYHLARWLTVDMADQALDWVKHHWLEAAIVAAVVLVVFMVFKEGKRLAALAVIALLAGLWFFARNGGVSDPFASKPAPATVVVTSVPTVIPTPILMHVPKSHPDASNRKVIQAAPVAQQAPATVAAVSSSNVWNPSIESRFLLDAEIAAIPEGGLVTSASVAINEGIPGDMAMSRLGDMVSDDYCFVLDGSKEKITAVTPTTLSLLVTVANGNPLGGILGSGSNSQGLYWEDVLAIHCDEVTETTTLGKFYQVTLIATNHKQPFIVQCQTEDEMNHLVSSLEWFLRTARNGKNIEVTSIPIPNQGMALNKDGQVKVLWDSSPAFKSLISWGDYVWNVDGKAHPDVPTLEKTLNNLPSGQHVLYAVAKDDWDKALIKQRQTNGVFNPVLEELKLVVP